MYRLMIVDDEPLILKSIQLIVKENFSSSIQSVYTERSGVGAINTFNKYQPDIILIDMHMPGVSGIDVIQKIRKKSLSVQIVTISAYDDFEYARRCMELNVMKYILKPVDKKIIINTIREVLVKLDAYNEEDRQSISLQEQYFALLPTVESQYISALLFPNMSHDPERKEYMEHVLNIEIDLDDMWNSQPVTFDIRLYDSFGNIVRNSISNNCLTEFNVSNLQNGFYYLHIYDVQGNLLEQQQIVIRH